MSLKWEYVGSSQGSVYRVMVPGGWLVLASESDYDIEDSLKIVGVGLCFYPDPEHVWSIGKDD